MRHRFSGLAFALCLLIGFSACDHRDAPIAGEVDSRGRLISAELIRDWSAQEIRDLVESVNPILPSFLSGGFPVRQYNLIYETVDAHGKPTIASGVACLPYTDSVGLSFSLSSYQHGTILQKDNVATRGQAQVELGVIFAAEGYAGALPDYLGLGDSPGIHPYVHANSEATAIVDMLRATRSLMEREGTPWDKKLFLYGYSQGGHATMAAHRYIQANLRDEFIVTASAPMAGPYDVSGVQEQVITGFDPYPTPGYLPFVLYSYNHVYNIVPDVRALLKPPYDSIIPPMMNGEFTIGEVNVVCNPVPRYMMKDSVMAAYEADPDHPLKLALRNNDLWDWVPVTPVKMFYCTGDDQVSYRNSIVAYDQFIARGASPAVVSLYEPNPTANHSDCAFPCFLSAKLWFDSLRAE